MRRPACQGESPAAEVECGRVWFLRTSLRKSKAEMQVLRLRLAQKTSQTPLRMTGDLLLRLRDGTLDESQEFRPAQLRSGEHRFEILCA